eukprot:CAMPEP_0117671380 /NCGR_PEP_ID=MMETSP0804-20121206/13301_1 /TAXON_ID=1074897 /ORGANISM="Tetraselmis astigmatica, Strain CCMP880" /LENGTH=601 /DNA_ID=CAMNT_0005479833 /DNA_START=129 /DNA_END=1934 /DNA_ORIENTATION=+
MVHAQGKTATVTAARRRSSLIDILKSAKLDQDIVDDVADACFVKEYTVLHLASAELSSNAVANELYLTEEEAERVQEACKQELVRLGVVLVEGGELPSPLEDDEEVEEVEAVAAAEAETGRADMASHPVPADEAVLDNSDVKENEDPIGDSVTVAENSAVMEDGPSTPPVPMESVEAPVEEIAAVTSVLTSLAEEQAVVEDIVLSPPRQQLSASMELPSSKPQRPQSAPPKSMRPKTAGDTANLPSYMRATAATMKKAKDEEKLGSAMKTRPTSASVTISPSLLRPTAASKAWSSGKSPQVKGRMGASTTNLDVHVTPSQKPHPTTPKPFNLRTSNVKSTSGLSTEEMRVQQAKAQMDALNEKRKKLARVMSAPPKTKTPTERSTPTQFKPFSLSSLQLHQKAMSQYEAQALEEKKREEAARKFKARPVSYNKAKTYTDVRSSVEESLKKEKKLTVAKEPVFQSEQRMLMHKRLEEEKKAREAEQMAADAEERRRLEEKEEKELKDMRKKLQFQAQEMPNFASPWKPDLSMATPPTKGAAPVFECDKRLGRKGAEGVLGEGLGVPSADNLSFFASTLRSPAVDTSAKKPVRDVRVEVKTHL